MADNEEYDEDLFADLYGDDAPAPAAANATTSTQVSKPSQQSSDHIDFVQESSTVYQAANDDVGATSHDHAPEYDGGDMQENGRNFSNGGAPQNDGNSYSEQDDNYGPVGIKEDGKMFIGGLNWETTDESLGSYFSQFGEVTECTVMRDGATGRSRGFGFLTFKDPKTVNTVMVKEHFLDGKIIDPKRAIPREEQERTAKIFVGGVSQEASEADFKQFFTQFGRVIDATLMMDKDTGRPRGFGFVTFDGEDAVDKALSRPLEIYGKPMEVKRAQPRSSLQHDEEKGKFGRKQDRFGRGNDGNFDHQGGSQLAAQGGGGGGGGASGGAGGMPDGISPSMMAKYWFNMQSYFANMQNMMARNMVMQQGQPAMQNPMVGGQMNPMMQQMMAMGAGGQGSPSPGPQGMAGGGPPTGSMSPDMMQQMQQQQMMQQQLQQQQQQQQQQGDDGFNGQEGNMGQQASRPAYNAHEQLAFEQQKYERQQSHRMQQQQFAAQQSSYGQGGPTSWDGMYDDVPQPNMPPQGPMRGGYNRQGRGARQQNTPPAQPSNAPANAPTGPKNAGKPGSNYRGGGRGGNRGYHPYSR